METPQSLHRPRSKWPAVIVCLVVVSGIGLGAFSYWKRWEEKRHQFRFGTLKMPTSSARVPDNWSAETLGVRLQKAGKVRDASAFEEVAAEIGLESVQPGLYALPATASPSDLAKIFKAGPTLGRVTFPEGFTGFQMAARLKKNGFVNADAFRQLVYPSGQNSPYEGTLFPQTYDLPFAASAKSLTARLQKQFEKTLKSLPKPYPKVNGKVMTTRQVITLASLIEREAASGEEMPTVAGVILNRLNEPMRLQIDAAILYGRLIEGKAPKKRLTYSDYKFKSPYNTYLNDGLPPGPICNPGADALKAAAHPAKTDALYYVLSPKSKHHRFAATYSQHLKNVRLAEKERAATP